ncbi:MAG: hypothetical protein LBP76_09040 [Treponema sp.]|nr:hypothetical protein [Treponema sp.]
MRKLVLILIAFIAVVTFIRAYDQHGGVMQGTEIGSPSELVNRDSE